MQIPLMLELGGQTVVCVGAGPIAVGKVVPLIECGALVTVIAPEVQEGLEDAHAVHRRGYVDGDLDVTPRPRLVVAATGVAAIDDRVAADAAAAGIWCLRIDGRGDVAVPSIIRRSGLVVSMTTGAPALTKRLRQTMEGLIDGRWGLASTVLAGLRADPEVRASLATVAPDVRRRRWHRAVDAMLDLDPLDLDPTAASDTGGPAPHVARDILTGDDR